MIDWKKLTPDLSGIQSGEFFALVTFEQIFFLSVLSNSEGWDHEFVLGQMFGHHRQMRNCVQRMRSEINGIWVTLCGSGNQSWNSHSILLHSGLNPAWHFWLSTRCSCCLKMKSVENILGYIWEQFYRFYKLFKKIS